MPLLRLVLSGVTKPAHAHELRGRGTRSNSEHMQRRAAEFACEQLREVAGRDECFHAARAPPQAIALATLVSRSCRSERAVYLEHHNSCLKYSTSAVLGCQRLALTLAGMLLLLD